MRLLILKFGVLIPPSPPICAYELIRLAVLCIIISFIIIVITAIHRPAEVQLHVAYVQRFGAIIFTNVPKKP